MAHLTAIPDDFLSGGKGLTPNRSAGEPDVKSLLEELQAAVSDAAELDYTPTTAGDWSPAPTTVGEALDQLAARVGALE